MKINKEHISRMQSEVWKMKDKIYAETKKMKSREFFGYINDKSKGERPKSRVALSAH
jgi:hypothetical protein